MKSIKLLFAALLVLLVGAGCSAPRASLRNNASIKKVAVVSLSVSDWGASVKFGAVGRESVNKLIQQSLNDMLTYTEQELGSRWVVKRSSSFLDNQSYRRQGVNSTLTIQVPSVKGQKMPVFTNVGKELKRGDLDPAKAKALCSALQVDAVVLVFSEWTTKTGHMVSMTKAVSKNVVSFWDSQGKKLAMRRLDAVGHKPIGAMFVKAVNENTIREWTDTYKTSISRILREI